MKTAGQDAEHGSTQGDYLPVPMNYEDLYNKEAGYMRTYLRGATKDVGGCMERCLEMIARRSARQKETLDKLRSMKMPTNVSSTWSLDMPLDEREDSRTGWMKDTIGGVMEELEGEVSRQEKEVLSHSEREKIFSQHSERLQAMREAVQQRRGSLVNQIKVFICPLVCYDSRCVCMTYGGILCFIVGYKSLFNG